MDLPVIVTKNDASSRALALSRGAPGSAGGAQFLANLYGDFMDSNAPQPILVQSERHAAGGLNAAARRSFISGRGIGMVRVGITVLVMGLVASPVSAQTWNSAQQGVLDVIEASWDAIAERDITWTDDFVHPNAIVWADEDPMPITRATEKEWDRFEFPINDIVVRLVSPAAIVVEGDTAVAHYYYSLGMEDEDGERETIHGRCTDILVADGTGWKFIAWRCGDEPDRDD
jgi:ketosteroid isomerase-like protein